MNIGARKLLQTLTSATSGAHKTGGDAAILPLLPGGKFEPSPIAMNGRDLVEKLCYERYCGAVYLQGEDANGELSAVVLVSDDEVIGALFSANGTQWMGAAAWTHLCALKTLLHSLVVPVEAPLLEAYSALLGQAAPVGANADARRMSDAARFFEAERQTGAIRVNLEAQSLVQFFHVGQSLGVFAVGPTGHLARRAGDWSEMAPLPRRARLELWKREAQSLFRSPVPFDASHTRALAGFLNLVFELGTHLMPPALARQMWSERVQSEVETHLWLSALAAPATLDCSSTRRATAWEAALKNAREGRENMVQGVGALADCFLEPLARSIGPQLFCEQTARALGSSERARLLDMGVSSRWLRLDATENGDAVPVSRLLDVVASTRFSQTPRRARSKTSSFDF